MPNDHAGPYNVNPWFLKLGKILLSFLRLVKKFKRGPLAAKAVLMVGVILIWLTNAEVLAGAPQRGDQVAGGPHLCLGSVGARAGGPHASRRPAVGDPV